MTENRSPITQINDATDQILGYRLEIAALENAVAALEEMKFSRRMQVERRAIDEAGGNYGKNEEDRKRFLNLAAMDDAQYQTLVHQLQETQARLRTAHAHMDSLRDIRRANEWTIRDRMVAAFESSNITLDEAVFADAALGGV